MISLNGSSGNGPGWDDVSGKLFVDIFNNLRLTIHCWGLAFPWKTGSLKIRQVWGVKDSYPPSRVTEFIRWLVGITESERYY
jgi:hypothetical protein